MQPHLPGRGFGKQLTKSKKNGKEKNQLQQH